MSLQQAEVEATDVVYDLTGTLLEVCTCGVLCPCWVGEDPDGGECLSVLSYNFTEGTIRGIDVSGRTIANIVHIPGNVLTPGSWRVAQFIDDGAIRRAVPGAPGRLQRQPGRASCRPGRARR